MKDRSGCCPDPKIHVVAAEDITCDAQSFALEDAGHLYNHHMEVNQANGRLNYIIMFLLLVDVSR